ncbi:hypothetical protein BOX15_Mlig029932g1, partial [Macrostomum lignano]
VTVVAFIESGSAGEQPLSSGPALSGQQLIEDLSGRLERLGAERESGQFSLDMEVYTPVQQQQQQQQPASQQQPQPRTLHVVASSEAPVSSYILPSGSSIEAAAGPLVSADSMFGLLLGQLRALYQAKPGQAVHCRGPKYRLADFTVRLATAVFGQSNSVKGVFVEAEYRPCNRLQFGWPLLKEFFSGVFPDRAFAVEHPNEALQAHLQAQAATGPIDYTYPVTVQQYLLLAYQLGSSRQQMRSAVAPSSAADAAVPVSMQQQQSWGRAPLPGPPSQLIGR